jgi:8-oxo-dGTP pyrophosphatase MutT (NUDIX family)
VVDRPEPTVILTERPMTMRRHPGQISFPGGRIDPGDDGPIAAALREAEEEIGLPRERVEIIGLADAYRTITGFEVTPVVGIVPPDLPLNPHPGEVAALFEAPLHYLLDPAHQHRRSALWRGQERHYYEIDYEGRRIWGATAAMIVNLSRRLVWRFGNSPDRVDGSERISESSATRAKR